MQAAWISQFAICAYMSAFGPAQTAYRSVTLRSALRGAVVRRAAVTFGANTARLTVGATSAAAVGDIAKRLAALRGSSETHKGGWRVFHFSGTPRGATLSVSLGTGPRSGVRTTIAIDLRQPGAGSAPAATIDLSRCVAGARVEEVLLEAPLGNGTELYFGAPRTYRAALASVRRLRAARPLRRDERAPAMFAVDSADRAGRAGPAGWRLVIYVRPTTDIIGEDGQVSHSSHPSIEMEVIPCRD